MLARRGEYVDRSRITVGEYLRGWLDAHAVEVKPRTLAGYRFLIDRYVIPNIGPMRLQAVRPATLTKLYHDLLESGGKDRSALSARTVDFTHAVLRKALNDAVRIDRLLASNPADRAKRPRRGRSAPGSIWSTAELGVFLRLAERHRLYAFFRLAAYTGARRGELLNLRWADVDLDAAKIVIRGSAAVIHGERVEGTTKGGRQRTVRIDPGTVQVLREHRARQAADRLTASSEWAGGDYVFTTGFGNPIYPDTVSQLMTKLLAAYNEPKTGKRPASPLPPARLHDLRHVHATTLLVAGVPVHVVAERLGHADPSITLRVYAHVIRRHADGIAEVFARSVAEAQGGRGEPGELAG